MSREHSPNTVSKMFHSTFMVMLQIQLLRLHHSLFFFTTEFNPHHLKGFTKLQVTQDTQRLSIEPATRRAL